MAVKTAIWGVNNSDIFLHLTGARMPYLPWGRTCKFVCTRLSSTYFLISQMLICSCIFFLNKKSPKMLGWSGGTFITLETFAFVFNLVLLSPMGGAYDEYGLRNFGFTVDVFQILLSLLFLGCMALYCVAIILYILKLREDDTGSEYTYGEFDDAGTIPAPPVATNLSRSSTAHSNYSVHHNTKSSNNQLTQTASHGHLSQCNSQYHIGSGQNHQSSSSTHKSPLLQDRRLLPRVNHLSQDRLNETNGSSVGSHYLMQHSHRPNAYMSNTGTGTNVYANYSQQQRGGSSGGSPYRQSQTLPHPHHYHRQTGTGILTAGTGQFPSRSRMDLASLTQTLARNSNSTVKRVGVNVGQQTNTSSTNYEGDTWEQPKVQALQYNYSTRKGITGSTIGIEV